MAKSRNWSNASAPCRVELRPSPLLAAILLSLGCLAALAVLRCEAPRTAAWLVAAAAVLHGARQAGRELRQPVARLVLGGDGRCDVDGAAVTLLEPQWRGPVLFLRWRCTEGRLYRRIGMPDVVGSGTRRELRLAWSARHPAPQPASMAP